MTWMDFEKNKKKKKFTQEIFFSLVVPGKVKS